MARHPGRAMACQKQRSAPTSEAAVYTGEVLSEAGCSQRKGFLHPTDRMCLPMLHPIFTQSCGEETPCGKSPSHTRVGLQALLDRVTVFAGLRTTLKFNVRQILGTPLRLTYHSQLIRPPLARWFTPNAMEHLSVAKYASISNFETSAARGNAGSLTIPSRSLESNFTRPRRHRADTYKH